MEQRWTRNTSLQHIRAQNQAQKLTVRKPITEVATVVMSRLLLKSNLWIPGAEKLRRRESLIAIAASARGYVKFYITTSF